MSKAKRRSPVFTVFFLICLIALLISGGMLLREYLAYQKQLQEQERVAQIAQQTIEAVEETTHEIEEPETEAYVSPINFEALREVNPDTVGWIRIPGTVIDYPIVQSEDNEKYLHTDFEGKDSVFGAVYLDCDSEEDFSGWNNPIYGHNMKNGTMFKEVVEFKEQDFFKEHQYFQIYTPERTINLKAVSCYYSTSDGIVRKTQFSNQESFDTWVKERVEPCSFAELPENSVDSMFVLVTCSYEFDDARTLLFAVEVDEEGNEIPAEIQTP